MIKKYFVFCLLICFLNPLHAVENPPLRVAVVAFSPPFVMQSANQHFYGFDIALMEYVCKKMNRRCEYMPMAFNALFEALETEKADVAVGGIIMTVKRSERVPFSTPYLVSKAQFIGTAEANVKLPFQLTSLADKRVGVLNDGAFEHMIQFMEGKKPTLVTFDTDTALIHALNLNQMSVALLSAPKARYWRSNSSGTFKKIGAPFPIGFGFAIAVNPKTPALVEKLDNALLHYQQDAAFKKNYDMYIKNRM